MFITVCLNRQDNQRPVSHTDVTSSYARTNAYAFEHKDDAVAAGRALQSSDKYNYGAWVVVEVGRDNVVESRF